MDSYPSSSSFSSWGPFSQRLIWASFCFSELPKSSPAAWKNTRCPACASLLQTTAVRVCRKSLGSSVCFIRLLNALSILQEFCRSSFLNLFWNTKVWACIAMEKWIILSYWKTENLLLLTLISERALWGNSWQIIVKSVPTMLTARKNMSVSGGQNNKARHVKSLSDRQFKLIQVWNRGRTFSRPGFGVAAFPEAWISGGGATLKYGVPFLNKVGSFGSLDFHRQAENHRDGIA